MSDDDKRLLGRRGARYGAVQAVYSWLMNEVATPELLKVCADWEHLRKADRGLLRELIEGVTGQRTELDALIDPLLDRPLVQIDPMEHAVMLVGAYELKNSIELPVKVVINEAIDLSRTFGAEQAHKYVNGVLDKLAKQLRPDEIGAR